MNKKVRKVILSVVMIAILSLLGVGAYSFFTDYAAVEGLKAESGVSLELKAETGIKSVSQDPKPLAQKLGSNVGWYKSGTEVTVSADLKEGYSFVGWYNGDTKLEPLSTDAKKSTYTLTGYTVLTAKAAPIVYNIGYVLDGGKLPEGVTNPDTYTVESGEIVLNNPTKPGYEFKGWTGSNGDEPQTTVAIPAGSTGDKTFTANWEAKSVVLMEGGWIEESEGFNYVVLEKAPNATSIVFTDEVAPAGVAVTDVSAAQDGGVVAWLDGTTYKVSTQRSGVYVKTSADAEFIFAYLENVKRIDLSKLDTSDAVSMREMFDNNYALENITFGDKWNTSKVEDFSYMFNWCKSLTSLDVSSFDTSSATVMCGMFSGCQKVESITFPANWDTSDVYTMAQMFQGCKALKSIDMSGWDTATCYDFREMFDGCENIKELDLSSFNNAKVPTHPYGYGDMHDMFKGMIRLEKVTLGADFAFYKTNDGTGYLPAPDSAYITGADGHWYNSVSGYQYAPNEVPNNTAATYVISSADKTAPELTVNAPAYTTNSPVTITGTVKDEGSGVKSVVVNGVKADVDENGNWTASVPVVEGKNTITVVATDNAGNSTTKTADVYYDKTPPVISGGVDENGNPTSIKDSIPDITNQETITVTGKVEDNDGIDKVIVNGKEADVDKDGNFSVDITLKPGDNEVVIEVTDKAGNKTTVTDDVIYDNKAPELTVTAPTGTSQNNPTYTNSNTVTVSGKVTDDNGVKSVTVNNKEVTVNKDGTWSTQITVSEGSNTITVVATDIAGNKTTENRYVFCDKKAPTLDITAPADTTENKPVHTNDTKVTVSGTVKDDESGIDKVTVNGQKVEVKTDGSWTTEITVPENKKTEIVVEATDKAGNKTTDSEYVYCDTKAPELTVTAPTGTSANAPTYTNTGKVTVTGTVTDVGSVESVTVNGAKVTVNEDGSWSTEITVSDGATTITVVATDKAGNTDTEIRYVYCDTKAPELTVTAPTGTSADAPTYTTEGTITVSGTVTNNDGTPTVTVNGKTVTVNDGKWSTEVEVNRDATTTITVVATDKAGNTDTEIRYARQQELSKVLVKGTSFNETILADASDATSVVFTDAVAPDTATVTDVSAAQDGGIVAWLDGTTYYVSTQRTGVAVEANANMMGMFANCANLTSINFGNNFDTSKTSSMTEMFERCSALETVTFGDKWTTKNATSMGRMFLDCKALTTLDVANWDVSKVTGMNAAFQGCSKLETLDVSKWDTSKLRFAYNLFYDCEKLKVIDVSKWNTSSIEEMYYMFYDCKSVTSLDVAKKTVTRADGSSYTAWDTSKVNDMHRIFYGCSGVSVLDVSNWNVANVQDMSYMFAECTSLATLDVSDWTVSAVNDMEYLFRNCSALTILDVSNWNVANVKNINYMFEGCSNVATLDVSKWNVSNVQQMVGTFENCSALTSLGEGNVSNWTTTSLEYMHDMFNGCVGLTAINFGDGWDTSAVPKMDGLFSSCESLTSVTFGSGWDTSKVTDFGWTFYGCSVLKELDLSNWDTSAMTSAMNIFTNTNVLEKVTIGANVSGHILRSPQAVYITGADGKWYDIATSQGYTPTNIPKNKAATYVAVAYDITYNLDGGALASGVTNPVKYTKYSEAITLNNPTKEGYTFGGWYTDANYSGSAVTQIAQGSTGNKIFYAKWNANNYEYNIVYKSSTGVDLGTDKVTNAFGGTYSVSAPAKTGYTTPASQSVKWDSTTAQTITFAYTPVEYNVTFTLAGGTGVSNRKYTIETETFSLGTPSRTGYTFKGWTGSNGTTAQTSVSIAKGSTGDKAYTANWSAVSYSITYNENGGSTVTDGTYTIESNAITLPIPTKTGYSFDGWYTASDFSGSAVTQITKGSTGNKVFYAKWNAYSYTVKFNGNGSTSGSMSDLAMTYGTAKNLTANAFSKTGYSFNGWNTKADGSGTAYTDKVSVNNLTSSSGGSVTLYAQWKINTYSITYNANGGSGVSNGTYTYETATFNLPTPTRSGYTFGGWYTDSSFSGSAVTQIAKGSTGNKVFYAKWSKDTYTISYNLNGGNVSSANPTSYDIDTGDITLNNPTKTGYTFAGWTGSNGNTPQTTVKIAKGSYGNKTYTANWTANSITFEYYANDGTGTKFKTWTATADSSFPDNHWDADEFVSRPGYTYKETYGTTPTGGIIIADNVDFASYSDLCAKHGVDIQAKNTVVTLYAQWELSAPSSITFEYYANNGTETKFQTWTATPNSSFPDDHYNADGYVTRTGYTYKGTYGTTPTGGIIVGDETSFKSYVDMCEKYGVTDKRGDIVIPIYAQWEINTYSITYNANGGSGASNSSYTVETATITLPTPTKTGYTFGGWYENSNFSGSAVTQIAKGSTGNKTFYAKWNATSYSITYNANGGSGASNSSYTVETATITLPTPTKTGYIFGGWYENSSFSGSAVTQITKGSTGNKTFYAKWNAISYSVEYILNGGSGASDISYTVERDTITLPTPTKTGYTFGGWYENSDFSGSAVTQIPKGSTGNKVFYAKWNQEKTYAVYSADDQSLTFYNNGDTVTTGNSYRGKTVTKIYTGFETQTYSSSTSGRAPWVTDYKADIKSVNIAEAFKPASPAYYFYNLSACTKIENLDRMDMSDVTSINWMFYNCSSLTTISGLSGWNTSSVTSMKSVFSNCSSLTTISGLSGWNTSSVTTIYEIFNNCSSLTSLDLSQWNMSNLETASYAFNGCTKLTSTGDLSKWGVVSKLLGMVQMFADCHVLTYVGDIGAWKFTDEMFEIKYMTRMFMNCYKLSLNLAGWGNVDDVASTGFNENAPGVIPPWPQYYSLKQPETEHPEGVTAGAPFTIAEMPDVAKLNTIATANAPENTVLYAWLVDSGMAREIVQLADFEEILHSVYDEVPDWEMTITPLYKTVEDETDVKETTGEEAEGTEPTESEEGEETEATEENIAEFRYAADTDMLVTMTLDTTGGYNVISDGKNEDRFSIVLNEKEVITGSIISKNVYEAICETDFTQEPYSGYEEGNEYIRWCYNKAESQANIWHYIVVVEEADLAIHFESTVSAEALDEVMSRVVFTVEQVSTVVYDITYEANGGVMPQSYDSSYEEGQTVTLPVPTKEGFTFCGWYESADFSGSAVAEIVNGSSDKTFYAKWEVEETEGDDEEVTDATDPSEGTDETETADGNSMEFLCAANNDMLVTMTLDTAGGYNVLPDEEDEARFHIVLNETPVATGSVVTKDEYEAICETDFTQEPYSGYEAGIFKVDEEDPNEEGRESIRWCYTDAETQTTVWHYIVVVEEADLAIHFESTVSAETLNEVLSCMAFTAEQIETETETSGSGTGNSQGGNATVYDITYEANGGMMPQTYDSSYDEGQSVTLPVLTKEGFTFCGWYENADFSGDAVSAIVNGSSDKTFYAKWEAVESEDEGEEATDPSEGTDETEGSGNTKSVTEEGKAKEAAATEAASLEPEEPQDEETPAEAEEETETPVAEEEASGEQEGDVEEEQSEGEETA